MAVRGWSRGWVHGGVGLHTFLRTIGLSSWLTIPFTMHQTRQLSIQLCTSAPLSGVISSWPSWIRDPSSARCCGRASRARADGILAAASPSHGSFLARLAIGSRAEELWGAAEVALPTS